MRFVSALLVLLPIVMAPAKATPVPFLPFDPEILIALGGDATDITNAGSPITVGPNGGGIFVFHNATGNPLSEIDINLNFPLSPLPAGFTVNGTIVVPPSPQRQRSTFRDVPFSGFDCGGNASSLFSCVKLTFILTPGPLVDVNQNFVLDFNNQANFTDADFSVENGTYTGGDVPGGTGDWSPNGVRSSGTIGVTAETPEPAYGGATLLCLAALLKLSSRSRRNQGDQLLESRTR